MKLITQAELGRLAGVTRQAIADAIKKGTIPVKIINNKRKIDLDNKRVKDYLLCGGDRKPKTIVKKKPAKKKQQQKPKSKTENKKGKNLVDKKPGKDKIDISGINPFENLERVDPLEQEESNSEKYILQCKKLEVDIKKIEQGNAEKRKELIPRELVKQFIDELYQIDSQEFLQLSSNLTAKICQGVFKNDDDKIMVRVAKIIDKESYKTLAHVQRKIDDFLAKIEDHINQEIA